MAARPFSDTLIALRHGALHDELTEKLNEVVAACVDTGKVGELVLRIKLKPTRGCQSFELHDEIKTKIPERERGVTVLFPTPENNLIRNDPRQPTLEGVRTVEQQAQEVRRVAGA